MNLWCASQVSLLSQGYCTSLLLCLCSLDNQSLEGLAPAGGVCWGKGTVAFSPWSHRLLFLWILGSPAATPVTNPLEMDFQLSNKSWAHNPIFREAQERRRSCISFSTKIYLGKHRRHCSCFLLTPLNSYNRGTAKKSREEKSKVQKQSQTQF